jgi:hypothetical protein
MLRKLGPEGVAMAMDLVSPTMLDCLQHKHPRVAFALWGLHGGLRAPPTPTQFTELVPVPCALEGVTSPSQIMPLISPICPHLDTFAVVQQARSAWTAWKHPDAALRSRQGWCAESDWRTDSAMYQLDLERVMRRRDKEQCYLAALDVLCSRQCSLLVVQYLIGGVLCLV